MLINMTILVGYCAIVVLQLPTPQLLNGSNYVNTYTSARIHPVSLAHTFTVDRIGLRKAGNQLPT